MQPFSVIEASWRHPGSPRKIAYRIWHVPTPKALLPTLLLCGAEDRIISADAAMRWFQKLRCEKRVELFAGCYHELRHESVRDEVLRLVYDWVTIGNAISDET